MQPRRILLSLAGVVALAAALAGTGSAVTMTPAPGLRPSTMPSQHLAIAIRPASDTTHGEHAAPVHLAVEPGLPVHITFVNYTRSFHTFTAPGLGVTALIRPSHGRAPATTIVTFTARDYGVFDWACLLCPGDMVGNAAAMHGKIYAIVQV